MEYTESSNKPDPKLHDYFNSLQTIDDDIRVDVLSKLSDHLITQNANARIDDDGVYKIIPLLVECLHSENYTIQSYAAGLLVFITKMDKYVKYVVEAKAIPKLIEFIESEEIILREVGIYGINLICRKLEYRELCVQHGIVQALNNCLDSDVSLVYEQNVTALLIALCLPLDEEQSFLSLENISILLSGFGKIEIVNDQIIKHILILLKEFSKAGSKYTQLLIDCKVCHLIVEYLQSADSKCELAVFKCFVDFVSVNDESVQHLIECNILALTKNHFRSSDPELKKTMILLLSNIMSEREEYIDDIVNEGFGELFIVLQDDIAEDDAIKQIALEQLSNIIMHGNVDHALRLIDENYIPRLCEILDDQNFERVKLALICIKDMLEKHHSLFARVYFEFNDYGGIRKIQKLQMRPTICKLANEAMAAVIKAKESFDDGDLSFNLYVD